MTKVEILQRTLELIKSGKEKYICDALREVQDTEWKPDVDQKVGDLKKWINELLEGCGTLEGWLSRRGFDIRDNVKMKATSVDWVEWMIEFWKNHEA
jgi:hypothetical protein